MNCLKGHEIQVLRSYAYYIGTLDAEGLPMCRISEDYYQTKESAQEALDKGSYRHRNCLENSFCTKGLPCF